jgi:hypothetical protein
VTQACLASTMPKKKKKIENKKSGSALDKASMLLFATMLKYLLLTILFCESTCLVPVDILVYNT